MTARVNPAPAARRRPEPLCRHDETVQLIFAICPLHPNYVNPDCGNCGLRQEAAEAYVADLTTQTRARLGL